VQQAQTAQAAAARAHASPVRELDHAGVAHHHVLHLTAPIHQHADAPAGLCREAGQLASELLGHQPLGREPAAVEAFELSDLVGLQTLGVAEDADGFPLP